MHIRRTRAEFIDFDEALPTGEQLMDESIIAIVIGSTESEESEEEQQDGIEAVMEPTQIKDAIDGGKAFLSYLEQNQVASGEEILTVMNLTDCLVDEEALLSCLELCLLTNFVYF
ncbi:hypothetical protein DdX_10812 [Ditylenchus destructor]|uniref:Uncharacterized protein n=1 Tax=Ditylenchus destructor TaxID=166010 RepID=A0AAD4MZ56_9BILA|nr:hypothetical protein DdX_10812 [Ditylenchus destructor]